MAVIRKYQVKIRPLKLELLGVDDLDGGNQEPRKVIKTMAIKMKWKGEHKYGLVPFHKLKKDFTSRRIVKKGHAEWDNDADEFENVCFFTDVSPWDVLFNVLYENSSAKMVAIGKVVVNVAELAARMVSQVDEKLPITLNIGKTSISATLHVKVTFAEIRDYQDSASDSNQLQYFAKSNSICDSDRKGHKLSQEDEWDESPSLKTQPDSVKKVGWFSWKRRRLSLRHTRSKEESLIKRTRSFDVDSQLNQQCRWNSKDMTHNQGTISHGAGYGGMVESSRSAGSQGYGGSSGYRDMEELTWLSLMDRKPELFTKSRDQNEGSTKKSGWEVKELESRDGQTRLKTNVFFASFDQCSDKAAGESACTTLVAVISHWLQSNRDTMPTILEFNNLILQGSSEWRKLCQSDTYINDFPNKHFDLETILHAGIRPIAISHDQSFVGFFNPEKFESLQGVMSFDQIWDKISSIADGIEFEPRLYIISWNDHFFVLKVEANAYYIIDTLGERLFEGCRKAYILRFDDNTMMYEKVAEEKSQQNESKVKEEMICKGKESCREFIKRFLAAIPLKELEEQEKIETVSYFSLHHRLQIEFNSSYLLSSSSSSLRSSPFFSSATSTPSYL
ncbi:hypothetical protein RND71_031889 [Anisodus tanguticus]|uniref:C2 NT-type domain-containing protein n=1 Tax=Anisodus tanguticus TaxID=243964 RepID=A0AAE1V591_9SOLA|nr:hypothetical protein RND71_031889 [Anisodus tanguticus]